MRKRIKKPILITPTCEPCESVLLEKIADLYEIHINYGPKNIVVYGEYDEINEIWLEIEMLVSERTIEVKNDFVASMEKVALWKSTQIHDNKNFPNPLEEYFITHPKNNVKSDLTKNKLPFHIDNHFTVLKGENF